MKHTCYQHIPAGFKLEMGLFLREGLALLMDALGLALGMIYLWHTGRKTNKMMKPTPTKLLSFLQMWTKSNKRMFVVIVVHSGFVNVWSKHLYDSFLVRTVAMFQVLFDIHMICELAMMQ